LSDTERKPQLDTEGHKDFRVGPVSHLNAFVAGEEAYTDGAALDGNPFPPGTPEHEEWARGFTEAHG
jgi:hypothetical protein